jgi:AcrR family transcriptional regulator
MSVQSGDSGPDKLACERRVQILEVALKLFAEKGVEGTTIKQIAERADISAGLLYHYFKGKSDLLKEVIDHRALQLPHLEELHDRPVEEVLPLFVRGICDDLRENIEIIWIFFREHRTSATVANEIDRKRQKCSTSLTGYLEARQTAGELREFSPEVAARFLMGALFSVHLTETPTDEFIESMVDIFIKGIKT